MPQDKLELSLRDSLAISAALRLSLSDLFSRIRGIAAHEAMLTPYMRQELEYLKLRRLSQAPWCGCAVQK